MKETWKCEHQTQATESVLVSSTFVSNTLKIKKGASVLGADLTESVTVRPLESDVYVSFIIPIRARTLLLTLAAFGVSHHRFPVRRAAAAFYVYGAIMR